MMYSVLNLSLDEYYKSDKYCKYYIYERDITGTSNNGDFITTKDNRIIRTITHLIDYRNNYLDLLPKYERLKEEYEKLLNKDGKLSEMILEKNKIIIDLTLQKENE